MRMHRKLEKCEKEQVDDPDAEVFNVSNNLYTYKDAKAICKAYDSEILQHMTKLKMLTIMVQNGVVMDGLIIK